MPTDRAVGYGSHAHRPPGLSWSSRTSLGGADRSWRPTVRGDSGRFHNFQRNTQL